MSLPSAPVADLVNKAIFPFPSKLVSQYWLSSGQQPKLSLVILLCVYFILCFIIHYYLCCSSHSFGHELFKISSGALLKIVSFLKTFPYILLPKNTPEPSYIFHAMVLKSTTCVFFIVK